MAKAHEPVDSYGTQNSAWDRPCGPTAWVRVDGSQEGSLEEVVFRLRHEG